nr:hypothetical protein [Tanacetum cinerariifolium]
MVTVHLGVMDFGFNSMLLEFKCARCGHPVNGPYCQGCALLREKLEEDLVTYLKYFQDTSESSDDSTNVVNTPREPFVIKKDHGVNPSHIDKCCCECGNALDEIFCQQCTCKSCGKGAHIGYNCPPKKQEEKRIEEEQAANARYWKITACCDDDDDYDSAVTPVLSTEETENPLKSMLNRYSSVISSSSKIDSLLDDFVGELTLLKSIPPGIDKADCHPKNEIRFSERLLYGNSPEEFVFENSNAEIESFSPSPIPIEDSDSHMEEIDLSFNPDDPMSPSIEDDDNDSEGDNLFLERLLHDDPIPLPDTLDFSNVVRVFLPFFTYPVTSSILHPFGNEDTIFDSGITINHFYSFKHGLSHRCGAFNTYRSHLNEWPMIINGKNIDILDVLLFHFYPP